MEEIQPKKYNFEWKSLAIVFALALIGMFSFQINIMIENKVEEAQQEGVQIGREEVFSEIKTELDTIKGYRFPIKKEDGTDGFRILIEIPSQ